MLKDSSIHASANNMAYRKGCRYFKDGRVTEITRRPNTSIYVATVEGTSDYEVRVRLDPAGENIEAYDCTCPAASLYSGACKHVVALLKTIQSSQLDASLDKESAKPTGRIFDCFARAEKRAHLAEEGRRAPAALRESPPSSSSRISSLSANTIARHAGLNSASGANGSTSCAAYRIFSSRSARAIP
ncbi:SWIM zinc finger family protein [Selenomonas sputigena]|uniref:SWIM zinc finger family protein n=1 Tax=Selenomonas sputigena TaxID=69823 RepID=A0ABV3X5G3_9FIRM